MSCKEFLRLSYLELLLWRTSLWPCPLQQISDIDHDSLFIRGSPVFRPWEICSLISGFDGIGRLAHIFHCWPDRLRNLAEHHSVRALIFTWFFCCTYAHPCLFRHCIAQSWTTCSMIKIQELQTCVSFNYLKQVCEICPWKASFVYVVQQSKGIFTSNKILEIF